MEKEIEDETKRPKVGLALILMDMENKNVLLGKRIGAHGDGKWAFPGGHLEFNENYIEGIEREMEEETDFTDYINYRIIDQKHPCLVTNDFFFIEEKHYITLFFRAKYRKGEPKLKEPDKCEEWRWYEWEKLPGDLFVPVKNLLSLKYNPFKI